MRSGSRRGSPGAPSGRPTDCRRRGPATHPGRARRAVGPLGHKLTPAMTIVLGVLGVYIVVSLILWAMQEKITFPAPRAPLPDPTTSLGSGEKIELRMRDGTKLVGWYVPPL